MLFAQLLNAPTIRSVEKSCVAKEKMLDGRPVDGRGGRSSSGGRGRVLARRQRRAVPHGRHRRIRISGESGSVYGMVLGFESERSYTGRALVSGTRSVMIRRDVRWVGCHGGVRTSPGPAARCHAGRHAGQRRRCSRHAAGIHAVVRRGGARVEARCHARRRSVRDPDRRQWVDVDGVEARPRERRGCRLGRHHAHRTRYFRRPIRAVRRVAGVTERVVERLHQSVELRAESGFEFDCVPFALPPLCPSVLEPYLRNIKQTSKLVTYQSVEDFVKYIL